MCLTGGNTYLMYWRGLDSYLDTPQMHVSKLMAHNYHLFHCIGERDKDALSLLWSQATELALADWRPCHEVVFLVRLQLPAALSNGPPQATPTLG